MVFADRRAQGYLKLKSEMQRSFRIGSSHSFVFILHATLHSILSTPEDTYSYLFPSFIVMMALAVMAFIGQSFIRLVHGEPTTMECRSGYTFCEHRIRTFRYKIVYD